MTSQVELQPQHAIAELSVYAGGELKLRTPLSGKFDVGRRRTSEPEPFEVIKIEDAYRLIIADRLATQISRSHLQITPHADGQWMLQNTSRNCRVTIDPSRELLPGKTCYARGVVRVHLHDVTLVIEPPQAIEQMISLGTPQPLSLPGVQLIDEHGQPLSLLATLGSSFDDQQGDQLMLWLRTIAKLFYSAADNTHLFRDALESIELLIGFDHSMVWTKRGDDDWHVVVHLRDGTFQSEGNQTQSAWCDAQSKVLTQLVQWNQTVLYQSESVDHQTTACAIVASPIVDHKGLLSGALMGVRLTHDHEKTPAKRITKLEASLIELIASGMKSDMPT